MRRFQFFRASAKLSRARVAAEHLERAQAHSLSRPRPAPETPLHPPSRGHPRAGHVRVRARFVVRKRFGVFVPPRGASRLGLLRLVARAHFFTNPSLVLPLFRSPIADRRVRRASRGVGFELFDTAHAERRDRRARAPGQQRRARRAQASVRGRARARKIAVARAIALERRRRLRGLRARAIARTTNHHPRVERTDVERARFWRGAATAASRRRARPGWRACRCRRSARASSPPRLPPSGRHPLARTSRRGFECLFGME